MLFKKKKRKYHVCCNFTTKNRHGFVGATVTMDHKIKTEKDVNDIRKYIIKTCGFEEVVVVNWIELK